MSEYVDGYVLPVAKKNVKKYRRDAAAAGKIWMKHGALAYAECVGNDLNSAKKMGCLAFPKIIKNKSNETIIFSYVVYKSRKHRDEVNKKVHQEMQAYATKHKHIAIPFDPKRMAFGGFTTIVNYKKK